MSNSKGTMQNEVDEYRKEISHIDIQIIRLLARRMALAPLIGECKAANGLKPEQPEREKKILTDYRQLAEDYNLSQDLVENIFRLIIDEMKAIQKAKANNKDLL